MNIFVLSNSPWRAAEYHCDKHVVKMILESAQILSTVQQQRSLDPSLYKPTHTSHPCTLWVAESQANYYWLYSLAIALVDEYRFRYGKMHKSFQTIVRCSQAPDHVPVAGLTPFVQCMPEHLRGEDPVLAYRKYYVESKSHFARWTGRSIPHWWELSINLEK